MIVAGFYVHIPFCRQACRYCDFHFSVSLQFIEKMIDAMEIEIQQKAEQFKEVELRTLYFGGGTPSVLSPGEINRIIKAVKENFKTIPQLEISFEANPDDLIPDYLEALKQAGIDRLSIGIQSFRDKDLVLMRRSHNAAQALEGVQNAKKIGFEDINCDLIYGIPGLDVESWRENLQNLLNLNIQHVSAYHLTFEPGTVFDHWRKKGRIFPVEEEESIRQFKILISETGKSGFIHYEISNFAIPGFFSKHNLTYWKNENYIGIGPSAHSYDGKTRFWNISSNKKYIEKLLSGDHNYYENEELGKDDLYNEYVLTSLRTMWGMDMNEIRLRFGNNYVKYTDDIARNFVERNLMEQIDEKVKLSQEGIFLADQIMREFFRI